MAPSGHAVPYKKTSALVQIVACFVCLVFSWSWTRGCPFLSSKMNSLTSVLALLATVPASLAWGDPPSQWGQQHGPPQHGPPQHGPPPHGPPHHGPPHYGPASTATASTSAATPSASSQSCAALTSDEVSAGGNNTLFTRWRPHSHVMAPAGWMNDPCAPMYDPTRDEYHIFYQWHPQHINWGNISWGYATSKDMITWTDHNGWQDHEALALGPTGNGTYNGLGIFSGTGQPVNLKGEVDGTLLLMYTSVSYLPTNWQAPYHPDTETTSLALSTDGGKTWEEYEGNPVIDATTETAPMYWNITGFRDPFLQPWPAMDELLEVSEPHYYAVYGSGIKDVGPRMPLWTAPASDLTSWTFLGALWEPADNTTLGPLLSTGTYGFNFEVSGFFSLPDSKGDLHYFVNMGTEGGNVSFHESAHWALWNEGTVTRRSNGSAQFTPIAGGAGDWGLSYALTSFNDTKNDRRVQWAWAPEDLSGDEGLFSASQQGFQGSLTFPRELFVHEVANVVADSQIEESKNAVLVAGDSGLYTAQTLGVKPLADIVEGLQAGATHNSFSSDTYSASHMLVQQASSHMQLKATVAAHSGAVGLTVAASLDGREYTHIIYEPSNHTLLVDRTHSSTIVDFSNSTVTGYFAPYTVDIKGVPTAEPIDFTVFLDGSLLEVYVNDRFVLTTRIYPSMECSTGYGLYVAVGESATFTDVEAWVGLRNVWPQRPLNSSSPLLWDTPAETNNYTWWGGN